MKKITKVTVEKEYDLHGNVVKETVVTEETTDEIKIKPGSPWRNGGGDIYKNPHPYITWNTDKTCPCRKENGGSGVCNCVRPQTHVTYNVAS